ncbi:MAG: acetoin utilization protein AcuC [Gammaproteobacteria bacterium]|nr:acetoin utilization protein AcuC [Gammaproteobacteria bacterium]
MGSSVAVVAGSELADYHFGEEHPFGPQRHQAFLDGMENHQLMDKVAWLEPVRCDLNALQSFHTDEYIKKVNYCSKIGHGYIDQGDTPARKGIYEAAATVVGSVLLMIDRVMDKQYRRGFVPIAGLHHGYRDRASGFCVFNDCCIAIEHLRNTYQLQKILYVDMDAHHGDGVYYNYESDSSVYIVDFHEDGRFLYPGTGAVDEIGSAEGRGSKMNIPMPMYATDADFRAAWLTAETFIRSIKPDFIIFHAGADAMQGDPITHLEYSEKSYQLAAASLCQIADEVCDGRLLALGGGGYKLDNISKAWPVVIEAMLE